jgi:phosphonate degradation associated HDIG domain protein
MQLQKSVVDDLFDILAGAGADRYGDECVSQLEHALQCAYLAERETSDPALITAALLHDVGHLMHKLGDNAARDGIDDRHEMLGYKFLRKHFGDEVSEPVRLHVDAKRYLCAIESKYFDTLSPASVRSLELQGGPFSDAEVEAFYARPFAREAIKVRRWDERAKIAGLETPDLRHFRAYADTCLR